MAAQHAAIFEQETDELRDVPARFDRFERFAPDEIARRRLERDGPREAGFEGILALVHVVAVQVHAGFQAQRVARTEAARRDAESVQIAPYLHDIFGGQHHFEAVFAGVARARDEPPVDLTTDELAERERRLRALGREQLRHLAARI